MKTLIIQSLNRIQGKNGSYWNRSISIPEADKHCIVEVDTARKGACA
ncbi:hypothetical protein ACFSFY_02140 [Sporosarcina siberiensis]|uniref:Uncharacterized protein n=1 Tax=Sporosarcina siberiensis TaxID=1365606 RepID=A0ABW4SDG4_9BACL